MARQLRIEYEGAFYHVTSRGNRLEKIYSNEKDKERFLEIMERTKERYGYHLHAYALMDNHYHLLIETPKANLSQIMQNINTSYTVYVNKKYKKSGHLFQGRFKSIIVDKDEYLVTLSRYIHLNPVRAKIVQKPEEARWTSYPAYIGKTTTNGLVDTEDTLVRFSDTKRQAMKKYREFVEAGVEGVENPFKEVEAGLILGDGGFKAAIQRMLDALKSDEELPQIKKVQKQIPIERVVKACSEYYGIGEDVLKKRSKEKKERHVAIYLAKIMSGRKNSEVGEYFGIKAPAVSVAIKVIEDRVTSDKKLGKEIDLLKERVKNEF